MNYALPLIVALSLSARAFDTVVVFNEIHYNPGGALEDAEWIEIHNQNGINVDITNWRISGGVEYTFSAPPGESVVIPGKGFLVIAKNPAVSGVSEALGPWTGSLNNAGETIRLRDNNDRIMDEVTYGDKGAWPIAPDGSGATLAKRSSDGGPDAADWTFSPAVGGTPGAVNFTPPPAPVSSRPVPLISPWKYSLTEPSATWKTEGYDDSAAPWQSGDSFFGFGGAQIYQPGVAVAPGGIWDQAVWTGDADSKISSTKTYTHKIGLHHTGAYTAINGVMFDSPGPNIKSGATWSLTGADFAFTNNGSGAGANNLPNPSGSRQLCTEFFYGASDNGTSKITLSGLTAGQAYIARFYTTGFGGPGDRLTRITPSDSGTAFLADENATNSGNGLIVSYRYQAPAGGSITFSFLPVTAANTWHHYAFSNELTASAPSEIEVTGVSVAAVSSELTGPPYTRGAANTVNGSGLNAGQHGILPEGAMWLSNGTLAAPNDPLPADITWDLGVNMDLSSLHVWNYNENSPPDLTARGSRTVEILTAATAGGPFTSRGTWTLYKASGRTTEPGQHLDLAVADVRQVKFNITAGHGGDNAFVGLSEVKFYKEGTPGPAVPTLYREPVATLYNSGVGADGLPVSPGQPDPHYTNQTSAAPVIAMSPHPAWLQDDGVSRFIGLTGAGVDNVAAGSLTYRTTADFTGYDLASLTVRLFVAADNALDVLRLNGIQVNGITAPGFASYYGPFTIAGPFHQGVNTFDFQWSNAGTEPNPGGIRIKWDATAAANYRRTVLASNPVTSYYRKPFTLTGNPSSTWTGSLIHVVDDGAVFYINGTEVARTNVTGTPTATSPADSEVIHPMFSSAIAIPPGLLHAGTNVLAVELHQAVTGASDALLGATLDVTETPPVQSAASLKVDKVSAATAGTFSMDLRNDTGAPLSLAGHSVRSSSGAVFSLTGSLAAGAWLSLNETALGFRPLDGDKLFLVGPGSSVLDGVVVKNKAQARTSGGEWMTPANYNAGTQATFSVPDSVVINEVMYHHHPVHLETGTTDNPEEWVELYNRSGSPVSLSGWKLRGGVSFDFTAQSIPAGGYLVVAKDAAALAAKYPAIAGIIHGPWSGSLSNREDTVILEDPNDNIADSVHYHTSGRWAGAADGGGSSLELRDPDSDNSLPESWAASDESAKSAWQTFTWSGPGSPYTGTNDPASNGATSGTFSGYNEFILGLLNSGECLVDDVSVTHGPAPGTTQWIQNGNFTAGNSSTWRLLGNHGSHARSVVQDDPSSPGNKVLRVVATGATEHMHNHCETTLKNGATFHTLSAGTNYNLSFRARWISGSPRLNARLYFNRLGRTWLLPMPDNTGTPGAPNSRAVPNAGPTFSGLTHSPVVPAANRSVTLRIRAADPDNVGGVTLKYRDANAAPPPAFTTAPMTGTGGLYEASIPGQLAGTLLEFYIEASDTPGATSRYPADNALIRWNDGTVPPGPGHGLRILMTKANSDFMHLATNVMSNDTLPATVIYKESEVFYDARFRLKSSQRGRLGDVRLGFVAEFDPMHKFRGKMLTVNFDRSSYGRGTPGSGYGQSELWNWHFFNRAGGIPSMFNDLVYLIAPRSSHTGSSTLTMAEFNDPYLDGQWDNGADFPTFKYELIYYPTTTEGGTPEGLKIPQPDNVNAVNIGVAGTVKEGCRWNFLIGNARDEDDYTRIVNLRTVFSQAAPTYTANLPNAIDVDQWLRAFAAFSLAGIGDHYSSSGGAWHNLKLYHREDGRILFLPWDHDFNSEPSNAAIVRNNDLSKMINANPAWHRAFYHHLHNIVATCFNANYVAPWMPHYQSYTTTGGNWNDITTYVGQRVAFVQADSNTQYPNTTQFAITTNGGNNFISPNPQTNLAGTAWINVHRLRLAGSAAPLNVTWTSRTAWAATVPLLNGDNVFTVEGLDYSGNVVATDSITITGTGGIVAADATNLVVSELHYNPADPTSAEITAGFTDNDDFEFIEIQNISPIYTVRLNNVRFTAGIAWNAVAGTDIPPGGRVVIPRRTAAFSMRYPGVSTLGEYYQAGGNLLDNAGEQIALTDAGGADIKRFTYDDNSPWPDSADGDGPSLVLVAPGLNPDHSNPLSWRASLTPGGNPGATDAAAVPANPLADDNGNGLTNLADYALGGALPAVGFNGATVEITVPRAAGSQVLPAIEISTTLGAWADPGAALAGRSTDGNGGELLTFSIAAPAGSRLFVRTVLRVP
jgi:hypothetical protein